MDGVAGKGGWAWIFILEGLVTFAVGKHIVEKRLSKATQTS
jgi:hypothetical protein